MYQSKYHPLVDANSGGTEKVPMFFSDDEKTVAENHAFYLDEIVPHYYRLVARAAHDRMADGTYKIHCPECGHIMQTIAGRIDEHRLALYACPKCK